MLKKHLEDKISWLPNKEVLSDYIIELFTPTLRWVQISPKCFTTNSPYQDKSYEIYKSGNDWYTKLDSIVIHGHYNKLQKIIQEVETDQYIRHVMLKIEEDKEMFIINATQ